MKKITMVIILLMIFLTGCDNKTGTDGGANTELGKEKIQIGISFDTFVVERWQRDRDVFVSKAKELGANVNVQIANGDVQEQISQMKYFIEIKVDVIVVVPIDADSLTPSIQEAKQAGIKVISYDRLATNSDVDLYISFDNEKVGELMGKAIEAEVPTKGKVIMVCGPSSDNNVSYVTQGFRKKMQYYGIEVLDVVEIEGWKAELAADYINDNIDTVMKAQAIMCGNDNLAGEVIRALAENRLAGEICVVGQDADLEGCQRIVKGIQSMTVYKPVEKLAQEAAIAAVALAKGEKIETEETIMEGTYQIPFIKLEPIAVTSQNMDLVIIDGGFHLQEDVYLYRPNLIQEAQ